MTFSSPKVGEMNRKSFLCNMCGILEQCAIQPACYLLLPELLKSSALNPKWEGVIYLSTLWVA